MFFRFQQVANLITVDDAYAELIEILPSGDFKFQFSYTVNPASAINHGASVVNVSVISRYLQPVTVLGNTQRGTVDTTSMVNNIRSLMPNAKTALLRQDKFVVASKRSNILSYVNDEILQMVRANVAAENIPQLNTPQLKLVTAGDTKQNNDPQPLLHRVANSMAVPNIQLALSASFLTLPQKLMQDMINRQGLDPSYIMQLAARAQSEDTTRGGLSNPSMAVELSTDPATQLANYHLFPSTSTVPPTTTDDVTDDELVQVMTTVTDQTVEIPVTMVLSRALLRSEGAATNFFVQFDLLDSDSGEPIDTVIKTLNVPKELRVYNTPKLSPTLKTSVSPFASRATLQIQQVDSTATAVQVFKKTIYAATPDLDTYALIGTYQTSKRQNSLHVQVDMPISSVIVYRVIPVGPQNIQGFEFASTVIKPPRFTPTRSIALTGTQVDQGIRLEVRNLPTKCVAIQFLRWNMTTHDSSYVTVNGDVGFIDAASRTADLITTVDGDVHANNVYRYVGRLIYENGVTVDAGDVTIEFLQPAPGKVNTVIDNIIVNHDSTPDVSFNINTITANTDLDAIKQMLGNQDLQQFFQGDLQTQRDQLQQLIAHNVQRVDLTTGIREDFGTVTVSNFVDSVLRKNRAINPLQYGHVYRYEIYPLLRASTTMFEALQQNAIDPTTKKPYQFSPSQFLHPLTLTRGVIITPQGASQRYAKDPMSFGAVGDVATIEASFDRDTAKIVNQTASRFNRSLNIIAWQVQGDIEQVDNFLIMKQVNGVRTLLGKAHTQFAQGACQYFHVLTSHDVGAISYVIVPVMNSYAVGTPALTNSVIVDVPWQ